GQSGVVRFKAGASTRPAALAVDDGSIYVAGGDDKTGAIWAAQLNATKGTLVWCKTFPRLFSTGSGETVFDLRLAPDGKLLIGGWVDNGSHTDFMVRRLTSDGSLDASFGKGGSVVTDVSGTTDGISSVQVQPDGRIVAAGWSEAAGDLTSFSLARYWP